MPLENCYVIAIVRVITSRNVRPLLTMDNVRVLIADSHHDMSTICEALEGCSRAFFVTKFWEKFDGSMEETQVRTVFDACAQANVNDVVFSTFEDTRKLRDKNEKSQIQPKSNGKLDPKFEGMRALLKYGKKRNITVTHMITSYLDQVRLNYAFIMKPNKIFHSLLFVSTANDYISFFFFEQYIFFFGK